MAVPLMVGAPLAGVLGGGGAASTAPVAALVSILAVVARVVGEGNPHPDGLARVGVSQGVGAGGCPVDLGVAGQPLVVEAALPWSCRLPSDMSVVRGGERLGHPDAVPLMIGAPVAGVFGPATAS